MKRHYVDPIMCKIWELVNWAQLTLGDLQVWVDSAGYGELARSDRSAAYATTVPC